MSRFLVLIFSLLLFSCKSEPDFTPAEDAMDAGRQFIDGTLKGEFKKANYYMLPNATNKSQLTQIQNNYDHQDADYRVNYRQASIIIDQEESVNDSLHIIHYQNSFDKKPLQVHVLRHNGQWVVDLSSSLVMTK